MAKRPTNEGLSSLSRIPIEALRKIDAWQAQANAIERAQFATVRKLKEQSKALNESQQRVWDRVLQAGEALLQNQPADPPPSSIEGAPPSSAATLSTDESESGAVSAEQTPEGIEHYLIGEVEERRRGTKKSIVVVIRQEGKRGRVLHEKELQKLPRVTELKAGDLLALESDATGAITIIDNLGQQGMSKAEIARVAYMIGNGEVPPKAIRDIEAEIDRRGESIVTEEIDRLASNNSLVSWGDGNFDGPFEHGKNRADFRELKDRYGKKTSVMTVDPRTARDHDDALHARELFIDGKEYVEVGVHIADVSHFVPMDKNHPWYALFERAKELGFTLYTPDKAFPMLPRVLSEKLCSLMEGDDRLSLSTVFLLEKGSGNIVKTWQGKSVMRCDAKIPYPDAQAILDISKVADDDARKPHHTGLKLLDEYGRKLREERLARGEVVFPERGELDATISDAGEVVAGVKEPFEMNKIVQDWMIQANEAKAIRITNQMLKDPDTFFAFLRFHEPPALESIKRIAEIYKAEEILGRIREYEQSGMEEVREVGSTEPSFINAVVHDLLKFGEQLEVGQWREESMRASVAKATESGEPHPLIGASPEETEQNVRARLEYLREYDRRGLQRQVMGLFTKAKYTTDALAHFSLSKFPYAHGTSPIRRFADTILHYLLQAALSGDTSKLGGITRDELAKIAEHLNEREKVIDEASDLTKAIWGAELFGQLRTADNPTPALSNVMVTTRYVKKIGKRPVSFLRVQMRHPSGQYAFTFDVPQKQFKGFPTDNEGYNDLLRKPLTVKLTDVDVPNGTVWLALDGAEETPSRRDTMRPEMLEIMKQIAISSIEDLETEFPEILQQVPAVRNEVNRLKSLLGTVTVATPANIVDGIGARTGSLRLTLSAYSGLSLEELLARRRRAPLSPEPLPRSLAAPRSEPSPLPATPSHERQREIQQLEREIASLRRRKEIADLEREIAELKSRRK